MIKIREQANWPHIRAGGWKAIKEEFGKLHNPYGVLFEDYLDGFFGSNKSFREPWVGVFHNPIRVHPTTQKMYAQMNDMGLNNLIKLRGFQESLGLCRGLFTLCKHTGDFLRKEIGKVEHLYLVAEPVNQTFDFEKFIRAPSIVNIGHWQRLYGNFLEIKGIRKILLKWREHVDFDWVFSHHKLTRPREVIVMDTLSDKQYDELLEKTVVFIELFDAAANNVVVECMVRNTPIVVNRLPALEEYLGVDYPLFYEGFEEAQEIVLDSNRLYRGSKYLSKRNKNNLELGYFVESFLRSGIYEGLGSKKML